MPPARLLCKLALVLLPFLGHPVFADVLDISPGSLNRGTQEIRDYYRLLKDERDQTIIPADEPVIEKEAVPAAPETKASTRTILITRFEVSPSEVLTPEQIAQVTDKYLNRELNINQLMEVVEQINNLYATETQIIARAMLPKQKVTDGTVKIQLVEARLGETQVKGNRHTRESFIQERVSLESGELISLDVLKDDLVTYNRWNDMSLKASIVPGEDFGTTDVVLVADEGDQYVVNVFADNAGRETVGEERIGIGTRVASLFGYRDRLYIGGVVSEGSENFWASYDIPVHRSGTRLGFTYDVGDIEIIDGPLEPLNVTGESSDAGFTLVQPIDATRDYDWDASLAYVHKSSESFFDGVKLVETTADDLIFGTNLRYFDRTGTWLTSHRLNFGSSDSVESKDYLIYLGSLIRLQYFNNGSSLIFRSNLQLSDTDVLPSFNQIIVGGTSTVRGYTEGLLSGDQGYTLSAEYAYPLPLTSDRVQRSNLFVFLDTGAAFPFRGDDGRSSTSKDYLTGVGMGIDFDVFNSFLFKLSVGFPLQNEDYYDQDSYRVNAVFNWTGAF